MKTFSIKAFVDALFYSGLICFVTFISLNYFLKREYAVILSSTAFSLTLIFFFAFLSGKNRKYLSLLGKKRQVENLAFTLSITEQSAVINLLYTALTKKGKNVCVVGKAVYILNENLFIMPQFSPDGITKTDVVYAYNLLGKMDRAQILCHGICLEVNSFISKFNKRISILGTEKFYDLLKETDLLPYINEEFFARKKIDFKNLLIKKHAKNYMVFGVVFYLLSFISPLKLYYIITGSLFLVLSVFTKLFGKTEN